MNAENSTDFSASSSSAKAGSNSTSMRCAAEIRRRMDRLRAAPVQEAFLNDLSDDALLALPWLFEFWALPHQLPPEGGRARPGAPGSAWAGAARARPAPGPNGCAPGGRRAPGGSRARAPRGAGGRDLRPGARGDGLWRQRHPGLLAPRPAPVWEATRGGWSGPTARGAGLLGLRARGAARAAIRCRLGGRAGQVEEGRGGLGHAAIRAAAGRASAAGGHHDAARAGDAEAILARPSTVVTHAPTSANKAWLAASFLEEIEARYGGTRLGRQELEGVLLEDAEGTLFPPALIEAARVARPAPRFSRVVVAVDPAVTGHAGSDLCGIVVVGAVTEGRCRTGAPMCWRMLVRGASPTDWARRRSMPMRRHGADRLVAEVNQGGDLVETVLRQVDPLVPYRAVRAARQGGARRAGGGALRAGAGEASARAGALEEQMALMTAQGFAGAAAPTGWMRWSGRCTS
jgi:hypothetical protein